MPDVITYIQKPNERPQVVTLQRNITPASLLRLRSLKVAKVALTPGAANAYAFAWQNPEDNAILITHVILDVTTAATLAAVLDVGSAATATTVSDNIMDAAALNAIAVVDHLLVAGAGAGGVQKLTVAGGATAWITGRILTQNAPDVAGYIYIEYTEI